MMPKYDLRVEWIDRHREPECASDPNLPDGVHIDLSEGAQSCWCELPYPAPRCGMFFVECARCGTNAVITTAGRPDDPRSIKLRCRLDA